MCTSKRNEGMFDVFPTKHIVIGSPVCSGTFSLSQPHFSAFSPVLCYDHPLPWQRDKYALRLEWRSRWHLAEAFFLD